MVVGGWSSGVSVGADVGGISNALIARQVYFFCNHRTKEADAMNMRSLQFSPLVYHFLHLRE